MHINCSEFEILLCEAVDGTLEGQAAAAFEDHRTRCDACRQYAADVMGASAFLARVPAVEPPRELLTKILFDIPQSQALPASPGRLARFRAWFSPVLVPRFAMGMAMTILSLAMLAQIFKLPARDLNASDLDPAQIWAGVEDRSYRVWTRVVKYYDNLRLVLEIQNRLKEWSEEEELERQNLQQNKTEKLFVPSSTNAGAPQ